MGITTNRIMQDDEKNFVRLNSIESEQIPYFAHWVTRFLEFAREHSDESFEVVLERFEHSLENDPGYTYCQVRQALDAIKIYRYQSTST
ncbi:MAG: hypothetical protein GY847_16570 [Proteobacteria bacterium]|nr:hypothetical protein [Pseudomonadota bacterium]